jgi:hypothetical protein
VDDRHTVVRYCGGNGNGNGDGDGSGVCQKRWFYLNNEFMIYKKDQKAGDKDVKGAIDLSEVEAVEVSPKRDIDVVSAEERRRRRRRRGRAVCVCIGVSMRCCLCLWL